MMDSTTAWTVWSRIGWSACADDRPLQVGRSDWGPGTWSVRNIRRFPSQAEAEAALSALPRRGTMGVLQYSFRPWED